MGQAASNASASAAYPLARSAWELRHAQPFPGRRWGVEQHCHLLPAPDVRGDRRVEFAKRVLRKHGAASSKLSGAEIAACGNPSWKPGALEFADMTYIEAPRGFGAWTPAEARAQRGAVHGQGGSCYRPGVTEADAQTLATIHNGTFDFVIAAHVLEHMRDVLGALESWLRVVRPGGAVMFMLPDPCDPAWVQGDGERARLATAPEHFLAELGNETLLAQNDREHMREAFLFVAGLTPLGPARRWARTHDGMLSVDQMSADEIDRWATADLAAMEKGRLRSGARLTSRHMHLWSWFTLRRMLQLAQPAFKMRGTPFRVLESYTTAGRHTRTSEFRVALQKLPERADDVAAFARSTAGNRPRESDITHTRRRPEE